MNARRRGTCILCLSALVLGASATVASCRAVTGLDPVPGSFEALPALHELDLDEIQPAESWAYWELRYSGPGGPGAADSIVGSGGPVRRANLPDATRQALDAIRLSTGWGHGCLPGHCFKYLVAAGPEGEVVPFGSTELLRQFLGERESEEEAVLLLDAGGYYWSSDGATGIQEAENGWRALVLELTSACAPVQTDRVLVEVGRAGLLDVLGRETWARHEGACI